MLVQTDALRVPGEMMEEVSGHQHVLHLMLVCHLSGFSYFQISKVCDLSSVQFLRLCQFPCTWFCQSDRSFS